MGEGAKRLIDAEDLVRWACAEELPKKRASGGFQPPPLHLMRDGELVGKWTAPAGFPAMHPMFAAARGSGPGGALVCAGEPDGDALQVQAAVYAIAREACGALATWPGQSWAKDLVSFDIGLEVDAEGALEAARRNVVGLVLAHGALGSRPDWRVEPFAVSPVVARNGKPTVFRRDLVRMPTIDGKSATVEGEIRCAPLRGGLYPDGSYCRLDYEPSPQSVVEWRADYLIWRSAIAALAVKLDGALERFEPLPPAAPEAPWIQDGQ